jgi:cell division protein FtsQ
MQPLSAPKRPDPTVPKADPAPSRWSYRLHRLWLTPVFRKLVHVGAPFTAALVVGTVYLSDEARRESIVLAIADLREEIHTRPEFMVNLMAVDGAGEGVNEDIREIVPVDFPISSFDLDLEQIRSDIIGLSAVKEASVRIRNGGILQIDVLERQPVALWRSDETLDLVDREGVRLGPVEARTARGDLPLIAGAGAEARIDEALKLFAAAAPLSSRMRGLVRMGERRWDLVLDRGQRIMLPEDGPVQALERVIALSAAQDMLARDLVAVDMRLAQRPTIRMNAEAVESWWKIREISVGNN